MKIYRYIALVLLISFTQTAMPYGIPSAWAKDVATLGEIRTTGRVYIGSSDGKWLFAGPSYPLIQHTAVMTEDGSATVYFSDGSRVALSKGTTAVIGGSHGDYLINLANGVMAFNVAPSASLFVDTASAGISVNNRKGLVQKVSFEKEGRAMGVITVSEKGTEARSISGRMVVNIGTSEIRIVPSGESMFAGPDNKYKVYKTDGGGGGGAGGGPWFGPFLWGGMFIAFGIFVKSLNDASPYRP